MQINTFSFLFKLKLNYHCYIKSWNFGMQQFSSHPANLKTCFMQVYDKTAVLYKVMAFRINKNRIQL